jgi:hydrogenase nickel incorporation protein HypA/HybF
MHELGIASAIVESVLHEIRERKLTSVVTIAVKVGALTDVDPESLLFGFEVLAKDTPLAATRLDIQRIPVRGDCEGCGKNFEVDGFVFVCPHCEDRRIKLTSGTELDIAYLEIPD